MEIIVNDIAPSQKNIKVTFSQEEVQDKYKEQLDKIRKDAQVPGFRSGKTPTRIIERKFGKNILDDMKRNYLVEGYEGAMKEHKIEPISEPEINEDSLEIAKDQNFAFEIDVETYPEFTLPDFKSIEVKKVDVKLEDSEVDEALEQLRSKKSELAPISGKSKEKDHLFVDITISDLESGEEILKEENYEFVVGEAVIEGVKLPKKFLTGLSAEDDAEKEVTLPKDFIEDVYANKKAKVSLKVLDVKRVELPELDDDFAKSMDTESLEDLKAKVSEQLLTNKEKTAQVEIENNIVDYLMENTEISIPEKFFQSRFKHAKEQKAHELEQQRQISHSEAHKEADKQEDEIKKSVTEQIKQFFILEKVAKDQDLNVTKEDVDKHLEEMAGDQGWPAEMRSFFESQGLIEQIEAQLKQDKIMGFLRGEVKEVEKEA